MGGKSIVTYPNDTHGVDRTMPFNVLVEADLEGPDPDDVEDASTARRRKFYVLDVQSETFSQAAERAEDLAVQNLEADGLIVNNIQAVDVRVGLPCASFEAKLGRRGGWYVRFTETSGSRLQVTVGSRGRRRFGCGHLSGRERTLLRLMV